MGAQYDAPNQQVVRPDGSGPADEGTGGSTPDPEPQKQKQQPEKPAEKPAAKPAAKPSEGRRGR